jgi:hypothetical protein
MADIPLKSDDEMTNDLVGAVENIAQSVKAGSRDFTKSFNGLTTAIKKLQTTLVNAIKAIKIQVVSKPEKAQKPAVKDKPTSTKEVVKEKETKTEVKPEPKAKAPKIEAAKVDVPKQPKQPKVVDPEVEAAKQKAKKRKEEDDVVRSQKLRDQAKIIALRLEEALKPKPVKEAKPPKEPKAAKEPKKTIDPQEKERMAKEKAREKEIEKRQDKVKPVMISSLIEGINQTGDAWSKMISGVRDTVADIDNARKAEEKKVEKAGKEGTKEFVGPLKKDFEENERKKVLPSGPEFVGPSKDLFNRDQKRQKDEEEVKKLGKEGTKAFVGPPKKLFENDEKATADAAAQAIADAADAAAKAIEDAAKRKEKAEEDAAKAEKALKDYFIKKAEKEAKAAADAAAQAIADAEKILKDKNKAEEDADKAEKTLREYFRNKAKKEAEESAKAANDLIKQQEQAARQLEQANQRVQKELDSMIAGFQRLTPLFKGPLVSYGLKMIAKGIGYKQPQTLAKGGEVSYLADGGDASNPMKPKGTDTQPAMLTPGEFVVKKSAAQDPENRKILESINSGKNKRKLGDSVSGSFLKSAIGQYKQGKDTPKTEYRSSGGSIGGGSSSKVGYYASGGSVGGVGYYAAGGPVLAGAGVAIAAIGTVINSVTKSFAIASEAVSSFASAVQKANPALMEQVGLAMDDLQGVIGRALTPAITLIIPLIRDFADYVDYAAKKFAPAFESIVKISKDLMKPMLELGVTITNALMPYVKILVLQFGGIVKILIPFIDLMSSLFETFTLLVGTLGDSEFLFSVFNNSIEILSRAVSIVAGTIQLVIGAFVVGVSKMIEVLGAMVDYIPFSGDAGKSIEGFGEKVGKVGEKLYNKSLENFKAVGEGKPRRFRAGEMSGDKGLEKDSSYGAAVRQVQSFSIAGIGDEMRKNALMAGLRQKTQEESLNQIEKNTGEMVELFKNMKVPQGTGAGGIVGPNPYAPATVNTNMGAIPGTIGTRYGTITPIN